MKRYTVTSEVGKEGPEYFVIDTETGDIVGKFDTLPWAEAAAGMMEEHANEDKLGRNGKS